MVHTRSGHAVVHMEASYGRAARTESRRKRQKKKIYAIKPSGRGEAVGRSLSSTPQRITRSQLEQEEELATPPSASNRLAVTPPAKTERILRGRLPRCSDFGVARRYAFKNKGFLFCNPCDMWDALLPDCSKKISGISARFACIASHETFSHPTSLRSEHCRTTSRILTIATATTETESVASSSCSSEMNVGDSKCEDKDDLFEEEDDSSIDTSFCNSTKGVITDLERTNANDNDGVNDNITTLSSPRHTTTSHDNQPHDCSGCHDAQEAFRLRGALIDKLNGKVALLRRKNQEMARTNKELRLALEKASGDTRNINCNESGQQTKSRNESFKRQVVEAINKVLSKHARWSIHRTGTLVAQAVWAQGCFLPELLKLSRSHFRQHVFTPFNILREMDLAGGTLSYEGIDVLRRVETGGLKRYHGSMIPSKSEIKRMAGIVEWFARPMCPFELTQTTKGGESVQFDFAKTTMCILRAFHLDEIGKRRSLSIASSIDGASLSKNLSIIAGGIKIIDNAARCPLTSKPLLDNPTTMKAQSRNLCIPLKIMMGRETKDTFVEFGPLFQFIDALSKVDTLPLEFTDFVPFRCMTNCDLSAQWKGLCKGGAAKVHTLPCTGCATDSDSLATPNVSLCTRWCYERSLDTEWMCFHKPMATPERVNTMKMEVAELILTLHGDLEQIKAESTMTCHDVEFEQPSLSSTTDSTSIHFIPTSSLARQSFSRLLSDELMLRGFDISGTLEERREKLKESLHGEATIARLALEIAHGEVKEGAYFVLMHTLPCVLHMENRNGIKLLTMLLIEGLSNSKKRLLFMDVNAEGQRVSRFVSDIENIINKSILGSEDDPCQWMCPFDTKKKEIAPITMDNVRTRRIVDAMDTLVDFCVTDTERASLWTTALNNYRTAMVLLRKRHDFTNTEVATYQFHADTFFQAWVRLWQKEGITNYIHMIGSGHIADYLYKWKNLYRFSQQGWEAMNSLIKTFFFRRTSHGGGVRGESKKSRLIPIARWLQRRLVFLCRINERSIRQYAQKHPMPKSFRTQMALEEDIYE